MGVFHILVEDSEAEGLGLDKLTVSKLIVTGDGLFGFRRIVWGGGDDLLGEVGVLFCTKWGGRRKWGGEGKGFGGKE